MRNSKKMSTALICGILGCLCMGGGDWLMLYGDPAYEGNLMWLTLGVANIAQWRYQLAMALAFPGVILYGIGLFAVQSYIRDERQKKIYHYMNAFGLTPWLLLHYFYVAILSLYTWMMQEGMSGIAATTCEAMFARFSWMVIGSEVLMLPVFVYWFYLQITGKTIFKKGMAFTNVLVIYAVLKTVTVFLPESAGRLAFINGLMSESMFLWFLLMLLNIGREKK